MIKDIHHIALVTTNTQRAARFFIDLLKFKESGRIEIPGNDPIIFVSLGGTSVELFGYGKPKASSEETGEVGYTHIALSVEDLDAECARLKEAGVEFTMEPTDAMPGLRIAFFKDPDGNVIEFFQKSA